MGETKLQAPLLIFIGGVPLTPACDGLAANYAGLYQFNLTVPAIPAGSQPLTFAHG